MYGIKITKRGKRDWLKSATKDIKTWTDKVDAQMNIPKLLAKNKLIKNARVSKIR